MTIHTPGAPVPGSRAVALVTGGARRVGRAIVLELARGGFDLVIHHRSSAAEAEELVAECATLGARAVAIPADLTRPPQIASLFERLDEQVGRLDVLVNNAACFRNTPAAELTEQDFDRHIALNLKAPYLCCLHAAPRMRAAGAGCIVNIADVAADRPFRDHIPYCISKAGLVMMTRAMAKAFAPAIRVNAVSPGTVLFRPDEDEGLRRRIEARIPMGRIGTPDDVARAVRFLVESPHITGAVIPVDGGRSLV